MGKTYIIACEKGIKKPVKRSLTFAKEVWKNVGVEHMEQLNHQF
jgi:hypothetical protein